MNAGSLALIGGVTYQLARSSVNDPRALHTLAASLLRLLRTRRNTTWLRPSGARLGLVANHWR